MMADVPPAIEAQRLDDGASYVFLGVVLRGQSADLDRAEQAAAGAGWNVTRTTVQPNSTELAIRFPAGAPSARISAYLKRVTDGEFGDLRLGLVSGPPGAPPE